MFSVVRRLREQRVAMVQTDDQYDFIFKFLRKYKDEEWIPSFNQESFYENKSLKRLKKDEDENKNKND